MKTQNIVQYKDGEMVSKDDVVAEEAVLHLVINSDISFDVVFTPNDIKEFVYGNLFTEGFIKEKSEISKYQESIKKNLVNVRVKISNFPDKKVFLKKNYNIVWTECGSSAELVRLSDQFKPLKLDGKISAEKLLNIPQLIKDKTEHFKQTGAFHYAFVFDEKLKLAGYAYDIGRHNAMDKALGALILDEVSTVDKMIYVTGRISSDILLKCLRARVPVLISRGAPFDTAIELAKKYNMCLIGFLRGKRFNIYSNPEIIERIE